jgi:predicted glycosyltransferase
VNLEKRKKILVAPLNSGLGHATRCIPIIEALDNHGFEPIIASDGAALLLLKKEFPQHKAFELPAYQIEYTKEHSLFNLRHIMRLCKMFAKITHEHKMIRSRVHEMGINGIISDSRPGAYYNGVPSVIITHQLNIIAGDLPALATRIQQGFIKKYRECWIPDVQASLNLSGKLGHIDNLTTGMRYMGTLSRLHKTGSSKKYDLAVLLTVDGEHCIQLEEKLNYLLKDFNGSIIFIRGVIEPEQVITQQGNISYYNFMKSDELEEVLNNSSLVLARPSYSNIMDLSKLCKKAFFIPIPGNEEQLYLAKKLKKAGLTPYAHQKSFRLGDLEKASIYKGLRDINGLAKWKDLFSLFEGK